MYYDDYTGQGLYYDDYTGQGLYYDDYTGQGLYYNDYTGQGLYYLVKYWTFLCDAWLVKKHHIGKNRQFVTIFSDSFSVIYLLKFHSLCFHI